MYNVKNKILIFLKNNYYNQNHNNEDYIAICLIFFGGSMFGICPFTCYQQLSARDLRFLTIRPDACNWSKSPARTS